MQNHNKPIPPVCIDYAKEQYEKIMSLEEQKLRI